MKKISLLFLCIPLTGLAQELRDFNKCDIIINQVLENTASFIANKRTIKTKFRFYLNNKKSSLNWNEQRLSKWQIIDTKLKDPN